MEIDPIRPPSARATVISATARSSLIGAEVARRWARLLRTARSSSVGAEEAGTGATLPRLLCNGDGGKGITAPLRRPFGS